MQRKIDGTGEEGELEGMMYNIFVVSDNLNTYHTVLVLVCVLLNLQCL